MFATFLCFQSILLSFFACAVTNGFAPRPFSMSDDRALVLYFAASSVIIVSCLAFTLFGCLSLACFAISCLLATPNALPLPGVLVQIQIFDHNPRGNKQWRFKISQIHSYYSFIFVFVFIVLFDFTSELFTVRPLANRIRAFNLYLSMIPKRNNKYFLISVFKTTKTVHGQHISLTSSPSRSLSF